MMSPDINETAVDKMTLAESTMAEPDNSDTASADASAGATSAPTEAETTGLSPVDTDHEEHKATAQQQPEASLPEASSPKISTAEKSIPETTKRIGQPPVQSAPFPEKSIEQQPEVTTNADTPAAEPAKVDDKQVEDNSEAREQPRPTKRQFIDITPFLKLMVEREASDMYFTCGAKVQIKINGNTLGIGNSILPKGAVNDILPGILNEKQLAEFEEEMELDTAFSLGNIGRFRINVFRQRGEVAIVIRQIKAQIPTVKDLQLPAIVESLIMEPRGLIIVAGATGTGKSTTVASMIDYRNSRRSGHILTIEDPIEFIHEHKKSIVNQREVGLDTKSFKEALRRAMREAPDVIMIGEIRDAETMKQALSYADTGHLCIATLHATNTTQCMERILGLFPEANRGQLLMDLSLNLRALICQRLMVDVNKKRVPATEVLLNEPQVKKLIHDGETHKLKDVLEKAPAGSQLHSFDNDMLRLYMSKMITMQEALNHADEPEHFKLKVNLGGGSFSSSGVNFD